VTENWLSALVNAAVEAEATEARHTQLSEAQAQGLLQWCLTGSSGSSDSAGSTGTTSGVKVSCVHCGKPAVVPMMQPDYEGMSDPLDAWWLCSEHRSAMQSIMGTPGSPGRPERSSHDQRIERYRALRRPHRSKGPQPEPPSMPRPGPGAPRPGIWR